MSEEERELLAAEYVLGTLEPENRQSFATALADDAALQQLVADWQQRLAPIDDTQAGIEPPARLWDAIDAAIDREAGAAVARMRLVRADKRRWRPIAPGVDVVLLHSDPVQQQTSVLVRLAAGARMLAHEHLAAEESLLLEGDLRIGDQSFVAGDFMVAPAGSRHPELASDKGCVAYIRGNLAGML